MHLKWKPIVLPPGCAVQDMFQKATTLAEEGFLVHLVYQANKRWRGYYADASMPSNIVLATLDVNCDCGHTVTIPVQHLIGVVDQYERMAGLES